MSHRGWHLCYMMELAWDCRHNFSKVEMRSNPEPRCDQNFPLQSSSSTYNNTLCVRLLLHKSTLWDLWLLVCNTLLLLDVNVNVALQRDCTLSIGFEGREAYPSRVHRDNKSKYCATPVRLNPRHCRHQSRVGRLDLSPYQILNLSPGGEKGTFWGLVEPTVLWQWVSIRMDLRRDWSIGGEIFGEIGKVVSKPWVVTRAPMWSFMSWDVRYCPSSPSTQFHILSDALCISEVVIDRNGNMCQFKRHFTLLQ